MALFIVNKSEIKEHPDFEAVAELLFKSKTDIGNAIAYEPVSGGLVTFGTFLTKNNITYRLELNGFDQEKKYNELREQIDKLLENLQKNRK